MLGRDNDRGDADRLAVFVGNRDLALAVGANPVDVLLLTQFGELVQDPVRQGNGERHQFGRLVAGVSEHQALVARSTVSTPWAISGLWVWILMSTSQVSAQNPISLLV